MALNEMLQKSPIVTVIVVAFFGLFLIAYQLAYFALVETIDFYSLVSEGIITFTILFILINLHRLHHKNLTFYYMNIGFSMLFISLLTDTTDELFDHPMIFKTILEDIFQVIGFILVFVGLKKWMRYNDKQKQVLMTQATTDELTGLYIRRYFLDKTRHEFERSRRSLHHFSILMIDIDHFKSINDKYGHGAGDLVLQVFSREIQSCIRKTDVMARWGGEEFIVLLVHNRDENITEICSSISEKIRQKTESLMVKVAKNDIRFTVSIGATVSTEEDISSDAIIDRSDQLLYQAKIRGRNCVAQDFFKV